MSKYVIFYKIVRTPKVLIVNSLLFYDLQKVMEGSCLYVLLTRCCYSILRRNSYLEKSNFSGRNPVLSEVFGLIK